MQIFHWVVSGVGLVCWLWVVVKMFTSSIVTGLCGLVCPLYALFWGFKNKDEEGLGTVMNVWGIAFLVSVVLAFVFGATATTP